MTLSTRKVARGKERKLDEESRALEGGIIQKRIKNREAIRDLRPQIAAKKLFDLGFI